MLCPGLRCLRMCKLKMMSIITVALWTLTPWPFSSRSICFVNSGNMASFCYDDLLCERWQHGLFLLWMFALWTVKTWPLSSMNVCFVNSENMTSFLYECLLCEQWKNCLFLLWMFALWTMATWPFSSTSIAPRAIMHLLFYEQGTTDSSYHHYGMQTNRDRS